LYTQIFVAPQYTLCTAAKISRIWRFTTVNHKFMSLGMKWINYGFGMADVISFSLR